MSAGIGKRRHLTEAGFVVMWSSGFIGASLGTPEAGTPTLMVWRFLLAAGLLLVGILLLRRRWPGLREIAVQGVVGLLAQGVYLTGVVGAVEFGVTAGTTALIAALQPLLAAALAGPVLGERVDRRQWAGLAVGLVGVALVVGGDVRVAEAPLWAYAMPFAGMAGLVAATLVERREYLRGSGLETPMDVVLGIQCTASALLFAALAPFWGGLQPAGGLLFWGAVAWFVVFSTFGGYGFYWLNLKLSSVARVSSLIYLTPPTTMVWAYLMFGERVGLLAVVGLVICSGGVLLARG
ncbi:MAG TPA: DMT family transporter [Rubrobacter sp.]|jgi:drug/metabolite transporter (DMT)-like permease|nr:EamA family transporter [Rubrobacteraceae bacterium]HET6661825.1 DMT family transporter [Rubrobacter sp.]